MAEPKPSQQRGPFTGFSALVSALTGLPAIFVRKQAKAYGTLRTVSVMTKADLDEAQRHRGPISPSGRAQAR